MLKWWDAMRDLLRRTSQEVRELKSTGAERL